MAIKAIFFDLDDTLHDHLLPFSNALKVTLPQSYEQVDVAALYRKFRHFSDILWKSYSANKITLEALRIERIILALNSFHITITPKKACDFQNQYESALENLQLFSDVPFILNTLLNKGLTIGIITNGPVEHQMKKINSLGLTKFFNKELIFISDAVGIAKPNPQLFEHVTQKTGFKPNEHLYIGDTWSNDIEASLKAGWQCIWFNHRNRVPETDHQPLNVIKNLSSIVDAIHAFY